MADKFWRFLESELANRRLGSMSRMQADPRLRTAAQQVSDWFACQCGIRPSLVVCVAWAKELDRQAEREFVRANPGEPEWKQRLTGPVHFPAIAEGGAGRAPLDGVLQVGADGMRFTASGESTSVTFEKSAVSSAADDAEGIRLAFGELLPYNSIIALASTHRAALDAALERAGITRD